MDFPANPTELSVAQYLTAAFATLYRPPPGTFSNRHKKITDVLTIHMQEFSNGNMEAAVTRHDSHGDEINKWRKKIYQERGSTPDQMFGVLVERVVQFASTGIMLCMYPPTAKKVTEDPWFVVPKPYVPEPIPVEDNPAGDHGGYEWLYGGSASPPGAMP